MDVKTAGRTVEVFELFARRQGPLSLSEVSRALNMPASSCMYLIRALEGRGYLYQVGTGKQVYPTRKLLDVALLLAEGEPWIERLAPALTGLRAATRETVILGKQQGDGVVYLAIYDGPQTIRYTASVGDRKPMHSSAIGKALLSAMEPDRRRKLIAKLALERITDKTLSDAQALVEDVEKAASRGYARTMGENVADVMGLACPISLGPDRYGVAVAGPIYRMLEREELHAAELMRLREAVEAG